MTNVPRRCALQIRYLLAQRVQDEVERQCAALKRNQTGTCLLDR